LDVCGPPGVGKSALCDPIWGPHCIAIDDKLPPKDWQPFIDEIPRLLTLIRKHWSIVPAIRMNRRAVRQMATVARMKEAGPYIQTGLVQRGLGFGWRLNDLDLDLNELRPYFELMPVSIGVAALTASAETIMERNKARTNVPETAHEDRSFMVPLMEKPREIAIDVLRKRGTPIIEIDTEEQNIEDARSILVEFANTYADNATSHGFSGKMATVQRPIWW